jgi:Tol biopolymer transport system component
MINKLNVSNSKGRANDSFKIVLIGFLLFNPFILFLFFGSLPLTTIVFFLLFTILILLFKLRGRSKILVVYSINLLAILSLLIHFEVVFRYGFPEYVIENLYKTKGRFYVNKENLVSTINDKEFSCTYKTNCQGYRIPESSNSMDSINNCDWLFVGDSYTQGAQVNFDQLYTSQLYKYFPDKIIVNNGVSGLGIGEELELYKYLYPKLNPSKVFLQLCNFNDFMNVRTQKSGLQSKLMEISDLYRYIYYNLMYKGPGELPIGRWTEPFSPSEKENINKNIFYKKSSEVKREDIKNFTNYLIDFSKETKKQNVELIVLLIPTKEQVYYKFLQEVISSYKIKIEDLDMFLPNRITKRLTDSLGIRFIDLYESYLFANGQVFFDFDEHLNSFGHTITAETIRDSLNSWNIYSEIKLISKSYLGERYGNYSNDTSLISYQGMRDGNMEVFISDKKELNQRITFNEVDNLHPMLSNDKTRIIYSEGDYLSGKSEVILENINGTDKIEISDDKEEYGATPVFSRSNKSIAYASWYIKDNKLNKSQIVIYDLSTKSKSNITNNQYENWRPFFSPDEKQIVFISRRSGNYDLFLMDLVTHSEKQLTDTYYDEWDPAFSVDGRKIIYSAEKHGNWDLFEYDLESKGSTQLTDTKGDEWDPFYISPNSIIYSGSFGPFKCIYEKNLITKNHGIPVF